MDEHEYERTEIALPYAALEHSGLVATESGQITYRYDILHNITAESGISVADNSQHMIQKRMDELVEVNEAHGTTPPQLIDIKSEQGKDILESVSKKISHETGIPFSLNYGDPVVYKAEKRKSDRKDGVVINVVAGVLDDEGEKGVVIVPAKLVNNELHPVEGAQADRRNVLVISVDHPFGMQPKEGHRSVVSYKI